MPIVLPYPQSSNENFLKYQSPKGRGTLSTVRKKKKENAGSNIDNPTKGSIFRNPKIHAKAPIKKGVKTKNPAYCRI